VKPGFVIERRHAGPLLDEELIHVDGQTDHHSLADQVPAMPESVDHGHGGVSRAHRRVLDGLQTEHGDDA
jgi:hypothetical protein